MTRPIIALTTDFGLRDPYVAEMKAVILSISSNATIVDVTHEIDKFNIRMGAFVLASASPYFPKGTIHLAIVDPGVGTKRNPILVQTRHCLLIGPDNGVLAVAAKKEGINHIYKITNRKFMRPKISNTFHGRDIFAPAAAHLANGVALEEFGREVSEMFTPEFAKITRTRYAITGEIIHIDSFGNIITNLTEKDLPSTKTRKTIDVKLMNTRRKLKFCRAYAEVEKHEPLAIIGSHDFLEISVNLGNAAKLFKIKEGDKVTVSLS
jgi:S-adenosylmethionine hydrolase